MLLVLFKKWLGKNRTEDHSPELEPLERKVLLIQQGDLRLRNQFIADYQPYIIKTVSRFCKRYIDPARDDEFSIALSAFNEALNQFSPNEGRSFLGFADTVIRRRLIDHVRKEQRHSGSVPLSAFEVEDDEQNVVNPVEIKQAIEAYEKDQVAESRRSEILDYGRCLGEFGIAFGELAEHAPKHADSRETLIQIASKLAGEPNLMRTLLVQKTLPIKELLDHVDVSRKTLERNRKYIIAIALILSGPYPYLQDYIQVTERSL
ncbi:RNA polymerase sigma factor SigI [Paenibacillus thermoaerophilus]|uniref:RNA polymerase sigma factor SigI n=1 Tax=Paenibacillus thermoaerophilus TaxID=1215385 RepID=A0ABW2V4F9_9BACL|nr:RNA polymerase sigma factor SigI [Paenibacillus thermoaerophilus]TMV15937.1 RNA polymerase sigma factor SigI [Paenibacillus thermoaerophilus]